MPYTVKYFGIPALGEPIRLLLHLGKIEFVDDIISFADWPNLKAGTKWGQLPILVTPDGTEMTQAKAIVRFLGTQVGYGDSKALYPSDAKLAFQVDEMIDAMEDVRMKIVPTMKIQDENEKKQARLTLFSSGGEGYELLQRIDKFCGDRYVVGDTLTIADIWFYFFLNLMRSGFFDGLPADYLENFPKLTAVVANVAAIEDVKEYYAKKDVAAQPMYAVFAK